MLNVIEIELKVIEIELKVEEVPKVIDVVRRGGGTECDENCAER